MFLSFSSSDIVLRLSPIASIGTQNAFKLQQKMGRNSKGVRVALLFCAVFSRSFVRGKLGSLPCAWLACCCSPIARRVSLVCFTLFLPLGLLTAKRQIRVAHTSQPPDHHHSPTSTSSLAFNHRLQSSPLIITLLTIVLHPRHHHCRRSTVS
jgi:arginine exporter protein ArgO